MRAAGGASPLGPLPLTAIVAASLRNGIGSQGTLPWRLSKDMAYFRAVTMHVGEPVHDDEMMDSAGCVRTPVCMKNAVIMGRHTWDSIPPKFRPLRNRINVVVSTSMTRAHLGSFECDDHDTLIARSLDEAVALLQERRMWRYRARAEGDATLDSSGVLRGSALGHAFVIGGAALYRHLLTSTSQAWTLDSLLVTRIFTPVDLHEKCDVFLTEFRSPAQVAWEIERANTWTGRTPQHEEDALVCPNPDGLGAWQQATPEWHAHHFPCVLPAVLGPILDDNGMAIQFQCWRRSTCI